MTDSSNDGSFISESEYEFVESGEDSSLSDGESGADCSITGVVERQLNSQDDTSTDSDIECTGVDLPEPSGEPSPKRRRRTLLDYFGKETPTQPPETYPQFLRRYEPTDVPRRSTRRKKSHNPLRKECTSDLAGASHQHSDGNSSHNSKKKRGSYKTYSLGQKIKIVQYARKHSEYAASMHYKVARSTIYGWKNVDKTPAAAAKAKKKFPSSKRGKHLKKGAGRPMTYSKEIDDNLIAWVLKQRDLHLPVRRLELKLKAKALICPHLPNFKASSGWIEKFMRRHSLSLRLLC